MRSNHAKQTNMDTDQSYFNRTNWFIWIGFTSSVIMLLLVGASLSEEWQDQKLVITSTADTIINVLIGASLALSFWLQIKIKKVVLGLQNPTLGQLGQLSALYALFLFTNEIFIMIGFYYGFILKDSSRFYLYGFGALLCNLLTMPNITLRTPKIKSLLHSDTAPSDSQSPPVIQK